MNTLTLDYRISEFPTQQEADDYDSWLLAKIEEVRTAPEVSHEKALSHFAAKRAERLAPTTGELKCRL